MTSDLKTFSPQLDWRVSGDLVPYQEAMQSMAERVAAIEAREAPELIWLLAHQPLYTAGTSAQASDLIEAGGFPVVPVGRGGKHTYHGPGQRVIYAMMDLAARDRDLKAHVWRLEEWIIRTLSSFDVAASRREGRIGVWVEKEGQDKKIAAIGVRARHWITSHGLALNVNPDLSHFDGIVPCGIKDYGVTSLHDLGVCVGLAEVDDAFAKSFGDVFG